MIYTSHDKLLKTSCQVQVHPLGYALDATLKPSVFESGNTIRYNTIHTVTSQVHVVEIQINATRRY